MLRGTLGYGSITCYFIACQMLPLADATTFTFLAPLIAALLSPLVLHESPGVATAFVIPICLSGVLLITQPSFLFGSSAARTLSGTGIFFGLLQPFFSASAKVRSMFQYLGFAQITDALLSKNCPRPSASLWHRMASQLSSHTSALSVPSCDYVSA